MRVGWMEMPTIAAILVGSLCKALLFDLFSGAAGGPWDGALLVASVLFGASLLAWAAFQGVAATPARFPRGVPGRRSRSPPNGRARARCPGASRSPLQSYLQPTHQRKGNHDTDQYLLCLVLVSDGTPVGYDPGTPIPSGRLDGGLQQLASPPDPPWAHRVLRHGHAEPPVRVYRASHGNRS